MLDPDAVFERLKYQIEHQLSYDRKQSYVDIQNNSIHIFGLGFDRWHFISKEETPVFLISLWVSDRYLYTNCRIFPCPIMDRFLSFNILSLKFLKYINHKENIYTPEETKKKKLSVKETKKKRDEGIVNAMISGEEVKEFANKIGKKKK